MKTIAKNWKVVLALLMVMAALPVFFLGYLREQKAFETEKSQLDSQISGIQATIAENIRYADIQEQIPDAAAVLEESRLKLYKHFPKDFLPEDQLMYLLYLEEAAGMDAQGDVGYTAELHDFFAKYHQQDIKFSFGEEQPILQLSDGSFLEGTSITVYFNITYDGFKNMIDYLAKDSRVASIQYAALDYDAEEDTASGALTLLYYTMESELLEYQEPDAPKPQTGKNNILY